MPPSASDRALRRLVTQLAAAHPADVEAVLDELDAPGRRRVSALLKAYLEPEASGPESLTEAPRPAEPGPGPILGLSAWLGARLGEDLALPSPDGLAAGASARPFAMTPTARAALAAAAADLPRGPSAELPLRVGGRDRGRSWPRFADLFRRAIP